MILLHFMLFTNTYHANKHPVDHSESSQRYELKEHGLKPGFIRQALLHKVDGELVNLLAIFQCNSKIATTSIWLSNALERG